MAETNLSIVGAATGHYGATGSGLVLGEKSLRAAYNLQGDPSRAGFAEAARRVFDISLPLLSNSTARAAGSTAFWVGPTSWLLLRGAGCPAIDFDAARDVLNAAEGALFDVSASRVCFSVDGKSAPDVLGALCPLDFHARAFSVGACAQSLLGRVAALFYRHRENAWMLLVPRSYARDAWHSLAVAAMPHGYEVTPPTLFG